jgi:hypothetical protein
MSSVALRIPMLAVAALLAVVPGMALLYVLQQRGRLESSH